MSKRFLTPGRDSVGKPAIYHCISRVVDRRFVFGDEEREQFRMCKRGPKHRWSAARRAA